MRAGALRERLSSGIRRWFGRNRLTEQDATAQAIRSAALSETSRSALLRHTCVGAVAWAFGTALLAVWDVLRSPLPTPVSSVMATGLLGITVGALLGGLAEASLFYCSRTRRRRLLTIAVVAAGMFGVLVIALNVIPRSFGRTGWQVPSILVMCGVVTLSWATWLGIYMSALMGARKRQLLSALGLLAFALMIRAVDQQLPLEERVSLLLARRGLCIAALGSAFALLFSRTFSVPVSSLVVAPASFMAALALFPRGGKDAGAAMISTPFGRLVLEIGRSMTDFDRDGYSGFLGHGDCAPFNPKINPGSREIPGNGVDDDCRLGDLRSLPATRAATRDQGRAPRTTSMHAATSIVLITSEALRADRLGAYGHSRNTTPNLDRWARSALRFEQAYSPGTRTSVTLPALHFGVSAMRLEWRALLDTTLERRVEAKDLRQGEMVRRILSLALEQPRPSVVQLLHDQGFRTIAIVDDGGSPYLDRMPGFLGDYGEFYDMEQLPPLHYGDRGTTRIARKLLSRLDNDRPFFLWVHYFGTHTPTTRANGPPWFGDRQEDEYDHELWRFDYEVQDFLADLDELQTRRSLAVFITSDHGEVFYPHTRGHGLDASEAGFHVPLFVRAPGLGQGASSVLVSLIDLFPTILALAQSPAASETEGYDLRKLAVRPEIARDRIIFTGVWSFYQDDTPRQATSIALGFGRKLAFDQIRNQTFITRLGDFSDEPVPRDAYSERLETALYRYIEDTSGMAPRP